MANLTYKNRLPVPLLVGYISAAPYKTGAGNSTPTATKAHSRASGFFTCKASSHLFIRIMVGRMGALKSAPVSLVAGSGIPVRLTTPSIPPLGGELTLPTKGASSWPAANAPTLTLSVPILRPKSIIACTAQKNWRGVCGLNPSPKTALWWRCVFRPFSAIWPTICATFTTCLTAKNATRNPPENLTQKQHSTCWWGVCLPGIQEAL
ncbi:ash family protein [Salmonella enterica subsp. enterica serovar Ball]|nr:ash family protein [Salmonella enterica subsp. enterica serovar Ball]